MNNFYLEKQSVARRLNCETWLKYSLSQKLACLFAMSPSVSRTALSLRQNCFEPFLRYPKRRQFIHTTPEEIIWRMFWKLFELFFPFSAFLSLWEKVNDLTGAKVALCNYALLFECTATQEKRSGTAKIIWDEKGKTSLTIIKCASQSHPRARQRRSYFFRIIFTLPPFYPTSERDRRTKKRDTKRYPNLFFFEHFWSPSPCLPLNKTESPEAVYVLLFFMLFFHYTRIFPRNLIVSTWIY